MFMNEYEIDRMLDTFDEDTNLIEGARTLYRLKQWTNDGRSDGWAYWPKPVRAAQRLMELLKAADDVRRRTGDYTDVTEAELSAVFRPIKAFLTRQGAEYSEVFYTNKHAGL